MIPRVTALVLNWNDWRSTVQCVKTLQALEFREVCLLVVDNDSRDASVETLRRTLEDVEILQTQSNLGYAGGNNVGIRRAFEMGSEYVLVINPDVSLDPAALSVMIAHCDRNSKLAAVCPVVRWKSDRSRVWFGGGRISWLTATANHEHSAPLSGRLHLSDWATGSCILLSTQALRQVGLFDVGMFLYWEEVDLCERLREAGFSVAVAPDAAAYHAVSTSVGIDSARGWYYFSRNAFRFFVKHGTRHGIPRWWITAVLVARFALFGPGWAVLSHDGTARARVLGCFDFFRGVTGRSARYSE
jgi:GT2 family glycosyltransferase